MNSLKTLKDTIFNPTSNADFEQLAMQIFYRQAEENPVYKMYLAALNKNPQEINSIQDIPFLPISFFKSHAVKTGEFLPEAIFTSSGTTGQTRSQHFVKEISIYESSFFTAFSQFYGAPKDYCVLALLPSYLERSGSSLVHMANAFIEDSSFTESGFYLDNLDELQKTLHNLAQRNVPTLLIGVSFALLDLADIMPENFEHKNLIAMETGGMKGRRKEMIREEMHLILKQKFGQSKIHSEYGMTELLSQAYSKGEGIFETPPWMRALVRDTTDPLSYVQNGKTGGVNIIDLANLYSCAFIATEDLGRVFDDGSFQILGRFDTAEIRGCNLMVE